MTDINRAVSQVHVLKKKIFSLAIERSASFICRVKVKISSNSDDIGCSNLANRPTTWQEIKLN